MERIVLFITCGEISSAQKQKVELLNYWLIFLSPVLYFVFTFITLSWYKNYFFTEDIGKGEQKPQNSEKIAIMHQSLLICS